MFNFFGLLVVVAGLIFFWQKMDIAMFVCIGILILFLGASVFANLCYIFFSTNNGKVVIKYYPIISLFKKNYESIEFAQPSLYNFQVERSMGFADLTIAIKTKRGIAEYPSISLSALNKNEIEQIEAALSEIRKNNRKGS